MPAKGDAGSFRRAEAGPIRPISVPESTLDEREAYSGVLENEH
jgi:hypothetical protein